MQVYRHPPSGQLLPARHPDALGQQGAGGGHQIQHVLGDGGDRGGAEGVVAQLHGRASAALHRPLVGQGRGRLLDACGQSTEIHTMYMKKSIGPELFMNT